MTATPIEMGFNLEEIIHASVACLPGVTACRETEIRAKFGDPSLNGVDHLITIGTTHLLIQDKWKESVSQPEVSQFLTCAERIRGRLPATDTIYLLWVSKIMPTTHAKKILEEHGVNLVVCGVSVEALARCAICQIGECVDLDPSDALKMIKNTKRPEAMDKARRELSVTSIPPVLMPIYDETEEGRRDKTELNLTISTIVTILSRVSNAISYDASYDVRTLWETQLPRPGDDWWSGKFSKIDYTGFLKAIKAICCPTAKKHLQSRQLYLYVKLRKASVELATHATVYEAKRKHMLTKKSLVAKSLPTFKVTAEPITEAEFKSNATHCEDYWENRVNRITGMIERVPAVHIDTAFWGHQCMI